ncbi:hypothetical protein L1049_019864 [Liquidambar formosana]|uniref:Disease resistance protein At4g27190-like leucine-rich repeats domain-containing protein n=1 Tax=Liquidambar formosana TaxID=63359 RepID=A0AAP0S8W0_LIQFO
MLKSLWKLEKITVKSCDSLEQVFDHLEGLNYEENRVRLLPNLEEMNLTELPKLRCIWNKDPTRILRFYSLRWLNIHKCNNLRNLFSPSMLPNMSWEFRGLKITNCPNMVEIVEKEKGANQAAIDKIVFCCSRYTILEGLPNHSRFYPRNHTLESFDG